MGNFFYILLFIISSSTIVNAQKYYGVNGHPVAQDVYREYGIDNQLRLVEKNFNIYRFDLGLRYDGTVDNESFFLELLKKSESYKVEILPIFTFNNIFIKSGDYYFAGRQATLKFLKKYPYNYNMIEVGNEEDNRMISGNGTLSGENFGHYNLSLENTSRLLFFKGICDVLKEKNIKSIINISYVHLGFLEILQKHDIKYDIVGFHWYSDMGDFFAFGSKKKNIINEIYKMTNKKILLTEFNVRKGLDSSSKNSWIKKSLSSIRNNKNVLGVIWYELLDMHNMTPQEQRYGFYENKNNQWILKPNAKNVLLKKY